MQSICDLVRAASEGDPTKRHAAFECLVRQFQDLAYGCAYGILGNFHLAQDASQDAFLTAYTELGKLEAPEAFPGWFKRIVIRKALRLNQIRRLPFEPIEVALSVSTDGPDQMEQIETQETQSLVHAAIEALPEHERIVTVLFYLTEYSQKKIAEFLDLSLPSVKKRLQRSRKRLEERIIRMVDDTLEGHRPSRDDRFANEVVEIIRATEAGDLSKLAALLARNPGLVDSNAPLSDSYPVQARGWKPLHIAAWHGHTKAVEFLLEQGAKIDAPCGSNRTPLHYAIEAGSQETRQLLLDKGADVDITIASILGMTDRVKDLLAKDPKLAHDSSKGHTPLEWAAWGERVDVARILLEHGARIRGEAIFIPAANGSVTFLRFLLDHGANPNVRSGGRNDAPQFDHTVLHAAVRMPFTSDNTGVIELLIERGADVNALDEAGKTPLDRAIEKGADGPYTANPYETSNEQKGYDKIIALFGKHGGKTSEEPVSA